jgi:hypothetical protein
MYARYKRVRVGTNATRYEVQEEDISLFGCNKGYIPRLLKMKLPKSIPEPYKWHVDVVKELGEHPDYPNSSLLIDLKPKQNKTNLSLYEVMDVWGYTANQWSPILLRLNGLFVDKDPSVVQRNDFVRKDADVVSPIYEFLYLDGWVEGLKLVGRWNPPPASPTNAALLWPDSLKYFLQCIRATTPEVLEIGT